MENLTLNICLFIFGVIGAIVLFFLYEKIKNSKENDDVEEK